MPLGLVPGIQLYSVRQQMAKDFEGTLAAVREAGFLEVESAALPKKPAAEIRKALDQAGLKCVSSHRSFVDVTKDLDATTEFEKTIGVSYIICPGPGRKNPPVPGQKAGPLTIDDWKYNAEEFNKTGEKLKEAGITFGYHNHWVEFAPVDGKVPYEELLAALRARQDDLRNGPGLGEGRRPGSRRPDEEVSAPLLHVPREGLPPSGEHLVRDA